MTALRLSSFYGFVAFLIVMVAVGLAISPYSDLVARLAVGLVLIALWFRYPYFLLLSWVVIGPLIGSSVPLANGNNFETALTVPTLFLLFRMPVRRTVQAVPPLGFFAALLLWMLMGITVSPLDHVTFIKQWAIYLDELAVAIFVINLVSTRERLSQFINVLLLVPVLIALFGVYGFVMHQNVVASGTGSLRITAIYPAAPPLALLLSNMIPLALYLAVSGRGGRRVFALSSLAILLTGVALTVTRGAIASLAGDFLVALVFLPGVRARFLLLMGGLSAGIIASVSSLGLISRLYSSDTSTLHGRTVLWQTLLSHFSPGSLLGNGLGSSFALLQSLAIFGGTVSKVAATGSNAQNLYITTLYENGIVGLLLLVGTFVAFGVSFIRGMLRTTGERRVLFVAAALTLLNSLALSIEGSDLFLQGIGLPFWIVMVLPFAVCWQEQTQASEEPTREKPADLSTALAISRNPPVAGPGRS